MTQSIYFFAPQELFQQIAYLVGDPAKTERISKAFKNANRKLYQYIFTEYENSKPLVPYCNLAKSKYEKIKMSEEQRYMALVKEVYTNVMENGASLQKGKIFIFNNTPCFIWEGKAIPSSNKLDPVRLGKIAENFAPYLSEQAKSLNVAFEYIAKQSLSANHFLGLLNQNKLKDEILIENAEKIRLWMFNNPQSHAKNLKKDGTGYTTAWKRFKKTKKICALDLSNYHSLLFFPRELCHLTNLRRLNLSYNKFEALPDSFTNLTKLQNLEISGNSLNFLPETFGNLTKIKKIWLSFNSLQTLPDCFEHFTRLKTANFSYNKLQFLPRSFDHCMNLKHLFLSNNSLSSLPESFGKLEHLEVLDLSDNKLAILPNSFVNFKQLKDFTIARNILRSLPCSFGNLKKLKILDLSFNNLNTLPFSFGNLTKLQKLFLDYNPLEYVPTSILLSSNKVIKHSILKNKSVIGFRL